MSSLPALNFYLTLALQATLTSKWNTHLLITELKRKLKLNNSCISPAEIKRMQFYILQALIVSDWITTLRDIRLKSVEKKRAIELGGATPLLDDLTDDLHLTSATFLKIEWDHQDSDKPKMVIAKYLLNRLFNTKNDYFKRIFVETLEAQDRSIRQMGKTELSNIELEKITRDKGGYSTLLYTVVLDGSLKPGETEVIIELGYAMQQLNDMFDIYKDHQNGVQTLFTNSNDINQNYERYQQTINKIVSGFYSLDYDRTSIRKCLQKIAPILSRGLVCIDQLRNLQGNSKQFKINHYTRKQMICDMEKPSNLLKSFKYSVDFNRQLKDYEIMLGRV